MAVQHEYSEIPDSSNYPFFRRAIALVRIRLRGNDCRYCRYSDTHYSGDWRAGSVPVIFFCDYPDCFLAWTQSVHSRDDLVLDRREYSCIVSGQYWDLRHFDFKRRLLLCVCRYDRHDQLPSEVNCGIVGKPARLGLCTNRWSNRQLAFECAT